MAEIIQKQELLVTITKVKIGKKDLTKSIVDQMPLYRYIWHFRGDNSICYGLPVVDPTQNYYFEHVVNWDEEYNIDGEIIGFINKSGLVLGYDKSWTLKGNKEYMWSEPQYIDLKNYSDNWKLIIYHSKGELRKAIIDSWTIKQLELEIEQIFI
ncbi:hypothetical protein [Dysgonomonas sp.]